MKEELELDGIMAEPAVSEGAGDGNEELFKPTPVVVIGFAFPSPPAPEPAATTGSGFENNDALADPLIPTPPPGAGSSSPENAPVRESSVSAA